MQKPDVKSQKLEAPKGADPGVLLHPLPGAMRITQGGVTCDKPMTVVTYLNHVNMCFAAILEMTRTEDIRRLKSEGRAA